jgi:hypothetical protein
MLLTFPANSVITHHDSKQNCSMLTLGMFSFVFAAFVGCVWWACNNDEGGAR